MTKRGNRRRGFGPQEENEVLRILARHIGPDRAIGMAELFEEATGQPVAHKINDTRELRHTISNLRRAGVPVCSASWKGMQGYYLALGPEDLESFCKRLERRGLKSLAQAAALRRLALPELLGQLAMAETGEDHDRP
jgi:hypothetical protein